MLSASRLSPLVTLVSLCLAAACADGTGPGGSCTGPSSIAFGENRSGSLRSEDCTLPDGRYVDRFSLSVPGSMTVRIDLSSTQFDAVLELHDSRDDFIAYNDDALGSLDSRLVQTVPQGDYVVLATTYDAGMTGDYRISVEEATECAPVGSIAVGETVSGSLTTDDCVFEYGSLSDNWTLEIDARRVVRVTYDSSDFEEAFVIRDPTGMIFNGMGSMGPGTHAELDVELAPGTYTIVTSAFDPGATGSYELTVAEPPPCGPGDLLELDVEVFGELASGDCALPGWGTADSYTLELSDETAIEILMKSVSFPPVIVLRNDVDAEVAWGYDMGMGSALLQATVPAGTYEVLPTSYYGATGEYHLTVSEATCPDRVPIAFGQAMDGVLTGSECRRPDGQYYDSWSLKLDDETEVQIDLTSAVFDTYLVLRDGSGTQIEANDDGGSGTNARIRRSLAAGTYELLASSYTTYATGGYRLTVDAPPPAATSPVPAAGQTKPLARAPAAVRVAPHDWWVARPDKR